MSTQPLRGGEFLIKETGPQSVFTPEDFNEEQKMVKDMVQDFLEKEILPNLDRIDAGEEGLVQSLLNKAGELGMLAMALPEEYGGGNMDFNTTTVMTEVIGAGHSFPVSLLAHTGIGTLPILYFGTKEQKEKYLPKLATGELKACYALTEPGSGSDALAAKTTAVDKGDHYLVNGQKMWITNANFADIFIVFAQVDGDKFSALIIERDTPGLTVGHNEKKMGIKGSHTNQVFFEDCKVPKENLLGEIGKGHVIAFNILNIGRFKLCAATLGAAKRVADLSVSYANERKQFKQPISNFGAIKHKLAEQAIRIYACESALYRASDLIQKNEQALKESGNDHGEALRGAAKEYAIECAVLKVFGSEVLDYVADEGVQIYGGYGFSEEYPVARAYRDSRINRIFEGTNEINRLLTLDMLVKKALGGELDLLSPAKAVQNELMSVPDFGSKDEGNFATETNAVKNIKKAVLMTAGAAVQKLKQKLQDEQEIILNIADMIMETFVCESLLLRVQKSSSNGEIEKAILEVYLNDALERIHLSGKQAVNAFASGDEQRMMLMGLKRFAKYKNINTKELRRRIAGKLIEDNRYSL